LLAKPSPLNINLGSDRFSMFNKKAGHPLIDMIFPFCGLSASGGGRDVISKAAEGVSPAFLGPLTRMEA
jgi:hypothetical protein